MPTTLPAIGGLKPTLRLTAAGVDQAEALWRIAGEQQDKVFAAFSAEQIETFKSMLKAVIAQG